MPLVIRLAIKDLFFKKTHLICNVAVVAGVLVPLLVLFGIKNGVYDTLIDRLLSNPRTLQIDTAGNANFSLEDAEEVRQWEEAAFVTLKTRSQFDFVNVRRVGGRGKRDAILIPSGTGDPNLGEEIELGLGQAAISEALSSQLEISVGDTIDVITQAEDRERQLRLPLEVIAVLQPERSSGRTVLADISVLDLVEAFYDAYALPEHGITEGKPLTQRVAAFEGMRLYAKDLVQLSDLQNRFETRFGISTHGRSAEVQNVLGLGRNLNLALLLTASVASIGLAAALIFGFWGEVERKRHVLATLSLMGVGGHLLWLFPVIQAIISAGLALAMSFTLFSMAAIVAETLFDTGLGASSNLIRISLWEIVTISVLVIGFVVLSSMLAARSALNVEPAEVLREGVI